MGEVVSTFFCGAQVEGESVLTCLRAGIDGGPWDAIKAVRSTMYYQLTRLRRHEGNCKISERRGNGRNEQSVHEAAWIRLDVSVNTIDRLCHRRNERIAGFMPCRPRETQKQMFD